MYTQAIAGQSASMCIRAVSKKEQLKKNFFRKVRDVKLFLVLSLLSVFLEGSLAFRPPPDTRAVVVFLVLSNLLLCMHIHMSYVHLQLCLSRGFPRVFLSAGDETLAICTFVYISFLVRVRV